MHCSVKNDTMEGGGEITSDGRDSVGVEVGAALGGAGNRFGEYTTDRIYVPRFGPIKVDHIICI